MNMITQSKTAETTSETETDAFVPPDSTQAVDDLLRPLRTANSQQEQLKALQGLAEKMPFEETTIRESVVLELLQRIVVVGTESEEAYYALLTAAGRHLALSAAVETLKDISNNKRLDDSPTITALEVSLKLIRQVLFTGPKNEDGSFWLKEVVDSSVVESDAIRSFLDPWISLVLLLPTVISNACHAMKVSLPLWSVASKYYPRLVERSICMAQREVPRLGTVYAEALIERMVRHRGGDDVAVGLYSFYQHHHNGSEYDIVTNLIGDARLNARESSILMQAMLNYILADAATDDESTGWSWSSSTSTAWSHPWLDASCQPLLAASRNVQDAFVRLTILSPKSVLGQDLDRRLCHAVASLLSMTQTGANTTCHDESENSDSDDDDDDNDGSTEDVVSGDRVLRRQLNLVAAAWSQTLFIQRTDYRTQRHVTYFLLSGMQLLKQTKEDPASNLTLRLLDGVTERLHSTIDDIRKDGMHVAETLAKRLGQELKFDELEGERRKESIPPVVKDEGKADLLLLQNRKSRRRKAKQLDPDAAYVSEEDESSSSAESSDFDDDDSIWDDDSALAPYDLEDDEEDLRETPRPLYLSDCLDLLRTAESEDHAFSRHEAALRELPSLIRSQPTDLADICDSLAMQLLRMENKFNMGGFSEMVFESLCSLTLEEPLSVGQTLIAELFEDGSLKDRLTVLSTLNQAAFELSGAKELDALRRVRLDQPSAVDVDRVSGKRSIVDENSNAIDSKSINGGKTRRWGRGNTTGTESIGIVNRFGPIAPVWFYSLVGHFLRRKEESSLWGGHLGSTLLAQLFVTLAVIVESCGNNPGTDVLAKDMFELVWSFRDVEVSTVRASVLSAVATSLALLREDTVLGLLLNESSDSLMMYLRETAANEPDDRCRGIARVIYDNISESIDRSYLLPVSSANV